MQSFGGWHCRRKTAEAEVDGGCCSLRESGAEEVGRGGEGMGEEETGVMEGTKCC